MGLRLAWVGLSVALQGRCGQTFYPERQQQCRVAEGGDDR